MLHENLHLVALHMNIQSDPINAPNTPAQTSDINQDQATEFESHITVRLLTQGVSGEGFVTVWSTNHPVNIPDKPGSKSKLDGYLIIINQKKNRLASSFRIFASETSYWEMGWKISRSIRASWINKTLWHNPSELVSSEVWDRKWISQLRKWYLRVFHRIAS